MITNDISLLVGKVFDKKPLKILVSKNPKFGDFAIATHNLTEDEISLLISNIERLEEIQKVEKVGIFVNLKLKDDFLLNYLKSGKGTKTDSINQKHILFEFGCTNTHKNPHIGHLFSYFFGLSMSNILSQVGHSVTRSNYQGDIGLHVAKCLYVAKDKFDSTSELNLHEKMQFLQDCYQQGAMLYADDQKSKDEIDVLNKTIYSHTDYFIQDLWLKTRKWSLDFYREFENEIGVSQEKFYTESELIDSAIKLIKENTPRVFEESSGAIVYPESKSGLHTRVFLTSQQLPTYEGKEIALAQKKLEDFPQVDEYITTTASEQNNYFQVIFAVLGEIFKNDEHIFKHFGFGLINLKSGKISSRNGAMSALDLIDEVQKKVKVLSKSSTSDDTIKKVALSAIKFGFLRSEAKQNLIFDIDESVNIKGASGPFILYSLVRSNSILKKITNEDSDSINFSNTFLSDTSRTLVFALARLAESIHRASIDFAPHLIAVHALEISQCFGAFYEEENISNLEGEEKRLRLFLTKQTNDSLRLALHLIGIDAVDEM